MDAMKIEYLRTFVKLSEFACAHQAACQLHNVQRSEAEKHFLSGRRYAAETLARSHTAIRFVAI